MKDLPGLIEGKFRSEGEFCALGATGVTSFTQFEKLFPGDATRKARVRTTGDAIMKANDGYSGTKAGRKIYVLDRIRSMKRNAQ